MNIQIIVILTLSVIAYFSINISLATLDAIDKCKFVLLLKFSKLILLFGLPMLILKSIRNIFYGILKGILKIGHGIELMTQIPEMRKRTHRFEDLINKEQ